MPLKKSDATAMAKKQMHKMSRVVRAAGMGVAATIIFLFGVGIGNGHIPIHLSRLNENSANATLPDTPDYATVSQVYKLLKTEYDGKLDQTKLLDGMKAGLAEATGDPYTQYFSKSDAQKFNSQLEGSFTGIGAELGQDKDGNLIVVSPIKGFPASKADIRPQDIIVSIDKTSTSGMSIDAAINKIRGPKGTKVTLEILRDKTQTLTITLTRDDIKVPSVKWELLEGKIGYITINQFSTDTSLLINQAAEDLNKQGAQSILLDLRGNPGGLLPAAVNVSKLWLPKGKTIVQEKRGGVVMGTETSDGGGLFEGKKTAVLINAGSASASEIVAGALRDNNAATLFGEKSYGKGSVQQIEELPGGAEIKITVARWYRPNGQNIDKKGITPDRTIKMADDDYKKGNDPQKDAALTLLKSE